MRRLSLLLALLAAACAKAPAVGGPPGAAGEVTFLVTADTHFGVEGLAERNRRQIEAMNALPGTPWPASLGGVVGTPSAVLVAGDLTDRGRPEEWKEFARHYGSDGTDGLLRFPVYLATGNHDRPNPLFRPVLLEAARRHGAPAYGFDLGELRVIALDMVPDGPRQRWLRGELKRVGRDRPLVLFFHFPLAGPWSDWWTDDEKGRFRELVEGYRVAGIFHGHYHGSETYDWRGLAVYNVGSPRHSELSFGVARWKDGRLSVASRNWARNEWTWSR